MTERRWFPPEPRARLTRKQLWTLFERQEGRCPNCGQKLEIKGGTPVCVDEHLVPLWRNGTNALANRELWCIPCTKPKTAREATERGKAYRTRAKYAGIFKQAKKETGRGFSKRLKQKMDGSIWDRETGKMIKGPR